MTLAAWALALIACCAIPVQAPRQPYEPSDYSKKRAAEVCKGDAECQEFMVAYYSAAEIDPEIYINMYDDALRSLERESEWKEKMVQAAEIGRALLLLLMMGAVLSPSGHFSLHLALRRWSGRTA